MANGSHDNTDSMSWFTTYYYEEELRSMLFNGAWNSGFKPGIYNPKMALYTISEQTEAADGSKIYPGVHLYIGKGTTFVFSNRYAHDDERYHLDLQTPGSYIIKSTAANDLDIPIVQLGESKTQGCDSIMGNFANGTLADPKFYIIATLLYNEEENIESDHPTIRILRDNPSFSSTLDKENDSLNFYYNYLNMSPTAFSYYVPDGSYNYTTPTQESTDTISSISLLKYFCWLPIGEVVNVGDIDQYLNVADWNDEQLRLPAAQEWTKNHVFIGRGMPSYRQSYIANKWSLSPDVIPNTDLNALYLDVNDIYDGDILYSSELSTEDNRGWEGPLGVGLKAAQLKTKETDENHPNGADRYEAFRIDYQCENPIDLAGADGDPDEFDSTKYTSVTDIITDLNQNYIKYNSEHPFYKTDYLLISDIIFLTTRHRYSNTEDDDLIYLFTKNNKLNNKIKVVPFRWYSVLDTVLGVSNSDTLNASFNPSLTIDEYTSHDPSVGTPGFTLSLNGYSLTETLLLPLDVCENNQARLYNIVKNKNIIPAVIDYLRSHTGISPYLNPIEATSLVPAAIVFRKVKVAKGYEKQEDGQTDDTSKPVIIGLTPMDYVSKMPEKYTETEDEVTQTLYSAGRFHPANVLSFFDMEYATNKLNPINFKSPDIYSVLPVIY